MPLSIDLISQFVNPTNDEKKVNNDTITYGTVFKTNTGDGLKYYVKLDGSSKSLPLSMSQLASSTIVPEISNDSDDEISKNGLRVIALIKHHVVTIIGSLEPATSKMTTLDGFKINVDRISSLELDNLKIKDTLYAEDGEFKTLETDHLKVKNQLSSVIADIEYLEANFITADDIKATYATIENLTSVNTAIYNLEATYGEFKDLTTEKLDAHQAVIDELDVTYANIDFSNIGKAAMEYFYAKSGLIDNVIVGDETITGMLVGVTIKGDLIEGNTIVADKLVIKGEDGLYYKLNTNGVTTEAEQTEYNSLNGSIITAKSITATQISVSDLVAFDATIGGFTITDDAIYSEVKDDEDNTTRGTYIGVDGTVNFGDGNRFIKYYQDDAGNWRLSISADTVLYDVDGSPHSLADLGLIGDYVKITTYEDEPCIELGETDSDFKLLITNTRMLFMEGSDIIAHISNQSLHIKKAVIEEELQQGQFVWKVRANGNMGLMWKVEI